MNRVVGQFSKSQYPAHLNTAIRAALVNVVEQKLHQMADWFYIEWADESDQRRVMTGNPPRTELAIEAYAGKSDATGCAGILILICILSCAVGGLCIGWNP